MLNREDMSHSMTQIIIALMDYVTVVVAVTNIKTLFVAKALI